MALRIRLARGGSKGSPFYRLVVADSRSPRDGKFVEILGTIDPLKEPAMVNVDKDKVLDWIAKGALPSDTARAALVKAGVLVAKPMKVAKPVKSAAQMKSPTAMKKTKN
jgi:small subunit ribosomal protein S16